MSEPLKLAAVDHLRTIPAKREEDSLTKRIRDEAGRVVAYRGHKQAADEMGIPESTLSHMLAGRGQRYLRVDWVPYLLRTAPDLELARALVEPAGLIVAKAPQVTTEESLIGLMRALQSFVQQPVLQPLLEQAHREALAEAAKRRGGQ